MAEASTIEWLVGPDGKPGATWPVVQGCDYESPGCINCYAVPLIWRLSHNPNPKISGPLQGLVQKTATGKLVWTGKVALREDRLDWPLRWRGPRRIFLPSHGDPFHPSVPDDFIDKMLAVVAMARQHTVLLLTKRAERMPEYFSHPMRVARILDAADRLVERGSNRFDGIWPLRNLHVGVSIEDRARLPRLNALRATPAALRWVSFEPLLEDLGDVDLSGIGWGVIGGESGCASAVRRFDLMWGRALLEQHRAAGIPCFVKQLGAEPWLGKHLMIELEDRKGGDPAEWPRDLRVREYPAAAQSAVGGGQSVARSAIAGPHRAEPGSPE
jgi:protein gp37